MGSVARDQGPVKKKRDPVEGMYDLYDTSVTKQAGDYDDIMEKFKSIYGSASGPGGGSSGMYKFDPYKAAQTSYRQSDDTTAALASLKDLSETGGLDAAAQQNLRARGISPIRAQYATAARDMDRQRRLSGATSANFGAVTSKMARDQSSLIADQMDKVNAGIAEMVQSGRLSAAPNYASAASAESQRKTNVDVGNTEAKNEAARHNASGLLQSRSAQRGDRLGAVSGMANLYGTTPALSNLYGSHAQDARNFSDKTNQRKKTNALDAFSRVYR